MNSTSMFDEIKLIVIDVDGTLTDGGIYYDESGNEMKKFCVKDAAGFFVANHLGIETMVLTGRECYATQKRMEDVGATYLFQNIRDKFSFLNAYLQQNKLNSKNVMYIGDDLNDLKAMKLAGLRACPKDSCCEIQSICNYVSSLQGGHGAVRECIEYFARLAGKWESSVAMVYDGTIKDGKEKDKSKER